MMSRSPPVQVFPLLIFAVSCIAADNPTVIPYAAASVFPLLIFAVSCIAADNPTVIPYSAASHSSSSAVSYSGGKGAYLKDGGYGYGGQSIRYNPLKEIYVKYKRYPAVGYDIDYHKVLHKGQYDLNKYYHPHFVHHGYKGLDDFKKGTAKIGKFWKKQVAKRYKPKYDLTYGKPLTLPKKVYAMTFPQYKHVGPNYKKKSGGGVGYKNIGPSAPAIHYSGGGSSAAGPPVAPYSSGGTAAAVSYGGSGNGWKELSTSDFTSGTKYDVFNGYETLAHPFVSSERKDVVLDDGYHEQQRISSDSYGGISSSGSGPAGYGGFSSRSDQQANVQRVPRGGGSFFYAPRRTATA
ncbi:unnamed protein product [Cyprideis torosa]|uniref:Uncharacterized protein n=1 Tax=Cyprideis torosa TaxID=163714 RepID=A0A7R8W188_9CRUS|nr:unnamed protein product [Cyprideis torosa]CAG0880642.1 unnamed protein product [Cyprideis torosa]